MLERSELILKTVCLALAILLVSQFARFTTRVNPLGHVVIPELPTLPAKSESGGTRRVEEVSSLASSDVKQLGALSIQLASQKSGTNSAMGSAMGATNAQGSPASGKGSPTNPSSRPPANNPGVGSQSGGGPPPVANARVDRITQSELLGPVIRPPPMALLGIAGKDVFLRAPNGQTGLLREGGELGGVKLLRVGTNRVVVEEGGRQKELSIFGGYGSESLLPKSEGGRP